ncbi:FAD-dependent thymidylate synthase [Crocosphaera chwakensis]|uniref:Flavin-dependent thymidylate synthase n=1 Tax=Crocosphaera chwakensis CCY0110 TaxID=391612 RepID=A3ILJ9_9CHRO|nr:FAD-dependent thymidylate synthase [Crocosphaera chwakensis]EAZ92650.1 FAD-dependent thymidylate synthase [Crocosphaera chwakensis CCY0110]
MEIKFNSGQVSLITITPNAEKLIAYCARVSSKNQENPNIEKLLTYCLKHGHWSIFEQASMTVEIQCPLAIAIQILRHRSFCFQQFSKRYQEVEKENFAYLPEIRLQDYKNRQNSIIPENNELQNKYNTKIEKLYDDIFNLYKEMIEDGVAKECARFVLPEAVMTKLYMTGNIRSFIHYIQVRVSKDAQKEHREVADAISEILKKECPIIWDAAFNN